MEYLVDTNILLRNCQPNHPMYRSSFMAVQTLLQQGNNLYITPQNIVEFWNVATRPVDKNGLGMTCKQVSLEMTELEVSLPIKSDIPEIYRQWRSLVTKYDVKGVNVHDARLAATAIAHGLTHILTFNVRDFKRYAELIIVHPDEIAES